MAPSIETRGYFKLLKPSKRYRDAKMIRTFSIFIAAVAAGKLIAIWNDDIGFYFTAILFVLVEMSPRFVILSKENKFRTATIKWMKENNLTEYNLKQEPPKKREINLQASDIQLIYVIKNKSTKLDDTAFYAVCGSWLLGLFSERIVLYKKNDNPAKATIVCQINLHKNSN